MKKYLKQSLFNLLFAFIAVLPMEVAYVITGSRPNAHRVTYSLITLMLIYFVLRNIYAHYNKNIIMKTILIAIIGIVSIGSHIIMAMDVASYIQSHDYLNVGYLMNIKLDIVFLEMSIYRYHVIALVLSIIFSIFIVPFKSKKVDFPHMRYVNGGILILLMVYLTLGSNDSTMYGRLYASISHIKVQNVLRKLQKPASYREMPYDQLAVKTPEHPKNIILFFIEAFDSKYVEEYPQYLPTFAKFAKGQGALYFSNNVQIPYNGWTVIGMTTSTCGVYGLAYRDQRVSIKIPDDMICLGDILHKAKYHQVFLAGDDKHAEQTDQLYVHQQFDEILDFQDINKAYPNQYMDAKSKNTSVTDNGEFRFIKEKLKALENATQPFIFAIYTRNSHAGYGVSKQCDEINKKMQTKYSGQGDSKSRLRGLVCDDVYMNDFLKYMKANGYDKNTKLILMGDHSEKYMDRKIYTAILNSGKTGISKTQIQQPDMAPTVLGLLGITTNYKFYYGNNLMAPIVHDNNIPFHILYKIRDMTKFPSIKEYRKAHGLN